MTDERPEPRYGQYAPAGWVSPSQAEPDVDAAGPKPDWRGDSPAVGPATRRWDLPVAVALLLVGVIQVTTQFSRFQRLDLLFSEVFDLQGIGEYTSTSLAVALGTIVNIASILILAATIGVTLWRIARHRTAFWIPIVGWAASLIVMIVCVVIGLANDPAFAAYASGLGR